MVEYNNPIPWDCWVKFVQIKKIHLQPKKSVMKSLKVIEGEVMALFGK